MSLSAVGLFPSSSPQDPTCYTSPTQTIEYHWPHGWGAYSIALTAFSCIFLAVMVIWMWAHYRPCESCGEYKDQCRCKQRVY